MPSFKAEALFRAWCFLALLASAHAAPSPELTPSPESSPEPQPDFTEIPQLNAPPEIIQGANELSSLIIPAVPLVLQWIASIGGLLGVISFSDTYLRKLFSSDPKNPDDPNGWLRAAESWTYGKKFPKDDTKAPWRVGIQVGLDGTGLQGASGEFPQICLWNRHGQLIGYNDQTIRIVNPFWKAVGPERAHKYNFETARMYMPTIPSGGMKSVGIWPVPGHEDMGGQQAAYVTMIKRHFDAICVAYVFLEWPDGRTWLFDGDWGRASNMSWYHSYVYVSTNKDDGTCFWLDHRGTLKHTKDLEEEYIGTNIELLGKKPNKEFPDYLWAANVLPEKGIPEGDDLTEGMRENGVHEYKVPLGVKFHPPAFERGNYGDNYDSLTVYDFVTNPGKMDWIMEPMRRNVRGGNPVLPILHPDPKRARLSDKNPELVWEDVHKQNIPADCLTDWYYDEEDNIIEPGEDHRCGKLNGPYCRPKDPKFTREGVYWNGAYGVPPGEKRTLQRFNAPALTPTTATTATAPNPTTFQKHPSLPLQKRHARTLVNDQNSRGEGSSTKELCDSPHSIGPSYANHPERLFCRMTDKTLWPFCNSAAGVSHDCFDAEAEILVEKYKPMGKRSHHWDAIEDWHSQNRFKRAV